MGTENFLVFTSLVPFSEAVPEDTDDLLTLEVVRFIIYVVTNECSHLRSSCKVTLYYLNVVTS